ncbi:MAG: four helix bundle protein [Calditrichae bacterium]|nr:four helix bundle protein [Calditrichota bacterium]MCB9087305.1 four helix bundle protein [Calditrichia bacterium]
MSKSFTGLKVYQLAYELAMEVFHLSKSFPKEEIFSLTNQLRRASRSVCANISEGYRKRRYPKHFIAKMTDADGEASETTVFLDFAKDCGYISDTAHGILIQKYEEVGKMLGGMANNPERFLPK